MDLWQFILIVMFSFLVVQLIPPDRTSVYGGKEHHWFKSIGKTLLTVAPLALLAL